ncbi:hypothetical protein DFJ43DRAFT_1162987 [Lentinula guzmanii]|uniref:Uncharacterized protein n=1 Tax=Lentinula guzmanii TaxID=2804957 RepID=A0AA38JIZ3_9AGAR|nr:hypothetical protein DFJ43DRAFT_1162987 [Lentinula guzmanii]
MRRHQKISLAWVFPTTANNGLPILIDPYPVSFQNYLRLNVSDLRTLIRINAGSLYAGLFFFDMLSLTRLLPALHLLVSILLVTVVTAAPTVPEPGVQVVSFMLAQGQGLEPLAPQKYDEPWTSPSELDVGIQIGGTGSRAYYASRNPSGTIRIRSGLVSTQGLVIGTVKMGEQQKQLYWNYLATSPYSSKSHFLEEVLGLIKKFDFKQNNVEKLFQDHMVEKVNQLQM